MRNILELEADIEVVGEAGNGREAITTVQELTPDVVLMDLSLPTPNGIETTQRVKRELPHTGDHRPGAATRTRTSCSRPSRPAPPPTSSRTSTRRT